MIGKRRDKGDQGVQGEQGLQGDIGTQGDTGDQGLRGKQGLPGDIGSQGDTGGQGVQGKQGLQGVSGEQGVSGARGAVGIQGASGIQGTQGTQGTRGEKGVRIQGWERAIMVFLMIVIVISTISTSIAANQAERAAKNTDLIAQCTTPGTKCFDLQIVQEAKRTAQNKCIIDALINLPPLVDRVTKRAEILAQYDKCVIDETSVNISTTTTMPALPTTVKNG
jgi:hypothetical protein